MAKKSKPSVFETLEAEVVHEAGEYVKEKVKKKVLAIGEISILVIIGFILISFGISSLLAFYFPILANGLSYVVFGFLMILISFMIKV